MRHSPPRALVWIATACALGMGCTTPEDPFPTDDELAQLTSLYKPPSSPPPDETNRYATDPRAIALGTQLFNDPQLSGCGTVSCASCHQGEGYTVTEAKAQGCGGNYTGRNPPTVVNAAYYSFFMWDGRADRLWNQALLPLTSPIEMNSNATILRARLEAAYADPYAALFGAPPSQQSDEQLLANFGKAVAAYEGTVKRLDAQFDHDVERFIAAVRAGTEEQDPAYLGLKTFVRTAQCSACHKTPMLTDNQFHNVGVKDTSEGSHGMVATADGMLSSTFNAAGPYSDNPSGPAAQNLTLLRENLNQNKATLEGAFKTPSLRNVALTAPYMHTGELKTLEEVVDLYNTGGDTAHQYSGVVSETIKPRNLTTAQKKALLDLLNSMTGAPAQP